MINNFHREREQLAFDDMTEAYLSWREECVALGDAFSAWRAAPRHERRQAWVLYAAALELEEQAAIVYRACTERHRLASSELAAA
jgi:hypothetical protein